MAPRPKPVRIDGRRYESTRTAADELGLNLSSVRTALAKNKRLALGHLIEWAGQERKATPRAIRLACRDVRSATLLRVDAARKHGCTVDDINKRLDLDQGEQ